MKKIDKEFILMVLHVSICRAVAKSGDRDRKTGKFPGLIMLYGRFGFFDSYTTMPIFNTRKKAKEYMIKMIKDLRKFWKYSQKQQKFLSKK